MKYTYFLGMEYLHHTLNPPIMHRDIAARNCLYGNEKVCFLLYEYCNQGCNLNEFLGEKIYLEGEKAFNLFFSFAVNGKLSKGFVKEG